MDASVSEQSDEQTTRRPQRRSKILHRRSEEESTDLEDSQRIDYQEKSDNSLEIGDSTFDECVDTLRNMSTTNTKSKQTTDTEVKTSTEEDEEEYDEEEITPPPKRKKPDVNKTVTSKSFNTRSKSKQSKATQNPKEVLPERTRRGRKVNITSNRDTRSPSPPNTLPPPKKAPKRKIDAKNTKQSKDNTQTGTSQQVPSASAVKKTPLGRKPKITQKPQPPQVEPLDLSFDDNESQSQSILKGASKAYFAFPESTATSTEKPSTSSKLQDIEENDSEIILPSQTNPRRRTHFPISLAGLEVDKAKDSDKKGKLSLKSKAKNTKVNTQPIVVSDEEIAMRKEVMSKLNTAFDHELKNQRSEVSMWAKLIQAKVNRIVEDSVREKLMHTVNELVIKALDGSWPEKKTDSPDITAPIRRLPSNIDQTPTMPTTRTPIPTRVPAFSSFRLRPDLPMPTPHMAPNNVNMPQMMTSMQQQAPMMWQHPNTPGSLYRLMASQGFDPNQLATQSMQPIHQQSPTSNNPNLEVEENEDIETEPTNL